MILADENVGQRIIETLRQAGIEVYSIRENQSGINDEAVIKLSQNPERIILTEDKDFGEWVFAHEERNISVILLRYTYPETSRITEILTELIKLKGKELLGKYTTITSNKIRIRSLK